MMPELLCQYSCLRPLISCNFDKNVGFKHFLQNCVPAVTFPLEYATAVTDISRNDSMMVKRLFYHICMTIT